MRMIVYGVGAIGGVLAAQLIRAGNDVVGIGRGDHLRVIHESGLRLHTPVESVAVDLPVVGSPAELDFRGDDVVLLAVKSQDTHDAVHELAVAARPAVPVVCMQNGVANEPTALRRFPDVYGAVVMLPTSFLEPGVVSAHSSPVTGVLDVGRYPHGTDQVSDELADIFSRATFAARSVPDVARLKNAKLLGNLSNAVEAVCGPEDRRGRLTDLIQEEAIACYVAAQIDYGSAGDERARRDLLQIGKAGGQPRRGASGWQSLARGSRTVEADYLNGEIVLLGRLHDVPTPANALVQQIANEMAQRGDEPGSVSERELLSRLEAESSALTRRIGEQ